MAEAKKDKVEPPDPGPIIGEDQFLKMAEGLVMGGSSTVDVTARILAVPEPNLYHLGGPEDAESGRSMSDTSQYPLRGGTSGYMYPGG